MPSELHQLGLLRQRRLNLTGIFAGVWFDRSFKGSQ